MLNIYDDCHIQISYTQTTVLRFSCAVSLFRDAFTSYSGLYEIWNKNKTKKKQY